MAKITIFGLAGTGTTTAGKLLATELGYEFISTGNLFRQQAAELGLSLYDFEKLCNENPSYDRQLDDRVKQLGQQKNNFVLESRLAWYFIPDSIKIKLVCDESTRIARVASRDNLSLAEATIKTKQREQDGPARYAQIYGLTEFAPATAFDLILDSGRLSPAEIVTEIRTFLISQ